MFESLLLGSLLLIAQANIPDANFINLKNKLQNYGFQVNIAVPPDYRLPEQKIDFQRRRLPKAYGLFNATDKSIWINPIVFELGNSNAVLVHETIHAAQLCKGEKQLQPLDLDLEPIKQAQPFFNRYTDPRNRLLEKEAYTVQTQANSYELAIKLLDRYCG
ncbi:MAG: hypothetical protein AAGE96_22930 [Cyanobacteria bacterium P01_G01_bin.19]